MSTALYWFRNDCRLVDNPGLSRAVAEHEAVLCVYPIARSSWRTLSEPAISKTGPHRLQFLLESLQDLSRQLTAKGGGLAVTITDSVPVAVSQWATGVGADAVYYQEEIMAEEQSETMQLTSLLPDQCKLIGAWGKTMYHPRDVGFPDTKCPEPFRKFRKSVELLQVRAPLPAPECIPAPSGFEFPPFPTPSQHFPTNLLDGNPAYPGGETAGLARLDHYLEESRLVDRYRYTRNQSLGPDYSTKFSPYLALGCLSPRTIFHRIKAYGKAHPNRGGSGVLFEMRWRDFFLFMGLKHGSKVFRAGGLKNRERAWNKDHQLFDNWRFGKTGIPFVDAHMRELNATGFMSNRGRVNCASFLTRDYQVDWRWGAAWFENRLIDYEVCANWFNWHTQAFEIYYTSAPWQGLKYDKQGKYVKTWLPELAELPAPLVHAPWKMEAEGLLAGLDFEPQRDYYVPLTSNSKWDWAWGRIKKGDASSPRRSKKKQ